MNRWIRRVVASASIATAFALVPGRDALAQQIVTPASNAGGHARGHHKEALLARALKLGSLTPEQRATIEGLVAQEAAAKAPVRQANAAVLTQLAQQVEQATVDPRALAPSLSAEETAAVAESNAIRAALNQLHAVLTPAQRSELVDELASQQHGAREHDGRHGGRGDHGRLGLTEQQKATLAATFHAETKSKADRDAEREHRRAALQAFRTDAFDAGALVRVERRGERAEKLAEALVPVLTPAQRAILANELRARAEHESHKRA